MTPCYFSSGERKMLISPDPHRTEIAPGVVACEANEFGKSCIITSGILFGKVNVVVTNVDKNVLYGLPAGVVIWEAQTPAQVEIKSPDGTVTKGTILFEAKPVTT